MDAIGAVIAPKDLRSETLSTSQSTMMHVTASTLAMLAMLLNQHIGEAVGATGLEHRPTGPVQRNWEVIWRDEFDGDTLSEAWNYEDAPGSEFGNDELQFYRTGASNVQVKDGRLSIIAKKESYTNYQYTSARIHTKNKVAWYPGMSALGKTMNRIVVEVRARVPKGQGFWPAIWMLPDGPYPRDGGAYGTWPSSGEIDIMETKNQADFAAGTLHYGGWTSDNTYADKMAGKRRSMSLSSTFHTFTLEWSADTMTWYVDGRPLASAQSRKINPNGWYTLNKGKPGYSTVGPDVLAARPNAPFDQAFYLILNLAVGGRYPGPPDAATRFPATFAVDYVRVYGAA